MKKYPSIRYPNEPETDGLLEEGSDIVVMEKLDGANFRWHFDQSGNIVPGTRNVEYKSSDDENIDKSFRHAVEYLEHVLGNVDTTDPHLQGITFYGEAMHQHTINYDAYDGHHPHPTEEDCPNVVVFDAVVDETSTFTDEGGARFLDHDSFLRLMDNLPLSVAPILDRTPAEDFDGYEIPQSEFRTEDDEADSEFDRKGLAEGVVYKRADGTVRAKKVHPNFKEQHTGGDSRKNYDPSAADKFMDRYVTEARIRKVANKLVEERPDMPYWALQMEMMEDLPREVLIDAMGENAWELLNSDFEFAFDNDFKGELRSNTSRKCARVLKKMVQEL